MRHLLTGILLLAAGCRSAPSHSARLGNDSSPGTTAGAPFPTQLWFTESRTVDLTGDGNPDSVVLQAVGHSSESLSISLRLFVDGQQGWIEEWNSDYELIDPPEFPNGESDRAAYLRARLTRAIESVSVSPFDSSNYAMMANQVDSTIIEDPPPFEVGFSYGYESTTVVAWRPKLRKFQLLWGCC